LNEDIASYHQLGWSKRVNSSISADVAGYCSVLSGKARLGKNCYLEVSYVHHDAVIGDNTVLSYIDVHDETIPSNVVLHGLKQNDGRFVVRIFGISDNPKARLGDGGSFFECGFDAFLENNGIRPEELWDGTERDIWNARLYPVCKTIQEALAAALNVHAMSCGKGDVQAWRRAERTSLCSGFNNADPHALIAWNNRMRELVQMDRLSQLIRNRNSAVQGKDILKSGYLTSVQQEWLDKNIARADYSEAMRLYYYVGTAIGGSVGQEYIGKCYKVLREAILAGGAYGLEYNANCVISRDVHTVRMPLRVNWGGGWSDTPPYCNENGGTVLNAAILLDGHMPVEVTLTRLQEKKIVVDSRDMDVHGEFMHIKDLQATGDPYDPCALQKAALLACGIIPCSGGDLDEILTRLGGGFHMQTEVIGVPKGSGLGTSSILSAACVKAIFEFFGIDYTQDTLCNRVLCIEQIMSTGGGWQDQIGGMIPGIKFCMSYPSLNQQVRVEELKITDETLKELQERFCLIYTGQRRLARNLLRDVVGRYIGNDPDVLYALDAIQRVAALMRFELERGHVDNFVHLLNEHWDLSRKIDAGSSNTLIDQIFDSIIDLIDGKMICGAGGGGFLQVFLKRGITTEQVHARLKDVFQDSDIDVWKCTLV